jgi:hypothetical protein
VQVSHGVNAYFGSELFHPGRNLAVTIAHGRRKKRTARAADIFTELGELLAACDDFLRQNATRSEHSRLPLPANARFDAAMRFVDRNKNLVRVVLPKGRKIHQQAMLVGHG